LSFLPFGSLSDGRHFGPSAAATLDRGALFIVGGRFLGGLQGIDFIMKPALALGAGGRWNLVIA
jgi:hypothetical protein